MKLQKYFKYKLQYFTALTLLLILATQILSAQALVKQNGKIVFSRGSDDGTGDTEIWTINPDGSNEVQLTSNEYRDQSPAYSPCGKLIVYVHYTNGGDGDIWLMNANGSNKQQLTDNSDYEEDPEFSPDGKKITYWKEVDSYQQIWVMNVDGTDQHALTTPDLNDAEPHWSPDGSKIAFDRTNGDYDIVVMDTDGSNQNTLPEVATDSDDSDPDWSPDGSKLVIESEVSGDGDEIYVIDNDGLNSVRLTNTPDADNVEPAWSPDGQMIVFCLDTSNGDEVRQLWVMNSDGSGQTRLTYSENNFDNEPDWQPICIEAIGGTLLPTGSILTILPYILAVALLMVSYPFLAKKYRS